jgi:hypothetical protein
MSAAIRVAFAPDELAVAVRHEEAHIRSRDNLKRLLLIAAPDVLPFRRGFGSLDECWRRLTEWATDDDAVGGSPERALSLASALVQAGRLRTQILKIPLVTPLLADAGDLRARVERLLEGQHSRVCAPRFGRSFGCLVIAAVAACQPAALPLVHRFLELLAH